MHPPDDYDHDNGGSAINNYHAPAGPHHHHINDEPDYVIHHRHNSAIRHDLIDVYEFNSPGDDSERSTNLGPCSDDDCPHRHLDDPPGGQRHIDSGAAADGRND